MKKGQNRIESYRIVWCTYSSAFKSCNIFWSIFWCLRETFEWLAYLYLYSVLGYSLIFYVLPQLCLRSNHILYMFTNTLIVLFFVAHFWTFNLLVCLAIERIQYFHKYSWFSFVLILSIFLCDCVWTCQWKIFMFAYDKYY